jgi:cytochrome c
MRVQLILGILCWLAVAMPPASAGATDLNAGPRQGPNLFGVVGRQAGGAAGFKYSAAFIAGSGGIVWDEGTLDRWLADPQSIIPGAVMLYKQADPDRRRLVIEYLKTRR